MSEVGRPFKDASEVALPSFGITLDAISDQKKDDKKSDSRATALKTLERMIAEADKAPSNKDGAEAFRLNMLSESGFSPEIGKIALIQRLTDRLKATHKDTWESLPKEHRDAMFKLQSALVTNDLDALKKWGKELDPEAAEKIAVLVEKNLRSHGVKMHIKSVDGQLLCYRDEATNAILIGKDGKSQVVLIEPNEPDGPPNIVEGKKPFKSVESLATELSGKIGKDINQKDLADYMRKKMFRETLGGSGFLGNSDIPRYPR